MEQQSGDQSSENKEQKKPFKFELTYFRPIGRIALIFFAGFSFYLFVSTIMLLFLTKPEKEVRVPGVVGKQFGDVYNSLMRRGLKPEIKYHDVYDIDNGMILDQYPDSGEIVYEGSTLKLIVSRSILYVDVPNLVGIELPFALNKLKNLHSYNRTISLGAGVISYIPSDKTAANIVIDQAPRPGEKITPDRKVNLLISAGKIEADMTMPDVTGQSIDLCIDLLLSKGLSIEEEIVEYGLIERSGIVEAQTPFKGSPVKKGDPVKLRVQYYKLKERPYRAYDRIEYNVDKSDEAGLYEAYVEDYNPKRIAFSRTMKPGQKIDFVFNRRGNARVSIVYNKKVQKVIRVDVENFR